MADVTDSTPTPPAPQAQESPEVAKPEPVRRASRAAKAAPVEAGQDEKTRAILATGRRKESVARVRLVPGTGQISINRQAYDRYFTREALRLTIRQPLVVTQQLGKCDVTARVDGGGLVGQAGAVRLGISRALLQLDPALRPTLRGAGFLTRDPRAKERKKYGLKGARKRFQWTKR